MRKLASFVAILVLICLLIPSLTFAAWWNPLSWFETKNNAEISMEISSSTLSASAEIKTESNWWNPFSWVKKEKTPKQEIILSENLASTTEEIISENDGLDSETPADLELKTAQAKAEAEKYKSEAEQAKLEVEKLKRESESKMQIQTQTQTEVKKEENKNTTVTLPNGAIVEMDEYGNIVRMIQEAPEKLSEPTQTTQQTTQQNNQNNTEIQKQAIAEEEQKKADEESKRQKELAIQKEIERQRIEQEELERKKLEEYVAKGTEVAGIISVDTIWISENNPYIITDDVLIKSEVSLIIEEDVLIKFNQGKFIQVMGYLKTNGNKEKPVIFTANVINPYPGIWGPIKIGMASEYEKGGNVDLLYSNLEYGKGITIEAQNFGKYDFNNFIIKNCVFENNTFGVYAQRPGPNSYIKNSVFMNNEVAVYIGWNIRYVQNPKNIDVVYNIFKNNNIGLQIANYGGIPSDPENHAMLQIKWNSFLQNRKYNLEMKYKNDVNYEDNWWGTTDISVIDSKIFDYFDDFEKGKVNYQPIATSEILEAGVQ